jgi:uncharacterized RDD family membrane protein YckC
MPAPPPAGPPLSLEKPLPLPEATPPATPYEPPLATELSCSATLEGAPVQAVCTVCNGRFSRDDMVRFGTSWVCAVCKPGYVQRLETGTPHPGLMRYAGFWIRFGAKLIDGLVLGVISGVISTVLSPLTMGAVTKDSPDTALFMAVAALQFILQIAVAVGYSSYFLGKHRATPGKMACGLVVVSPDGATLSYGRGAGRYFGELLSSFTLGIGYLMVAFDEERRALHDRVCNTRVIYR